MAHLKAITLRTRKWAQALFKWCVKNISSEELAVINNMATPKQLIAYKHSLSLCRLVSNMEPSHDWLVLNCL